MSGDSIFGFMMGGQSRHIEDEVMPLTRLQQRPYGDHYRQLANFKIIFVIYFMNFPDFFVAYEF